jgi:YD repeat-containing protein
VVLVVSGVGTDRARTDQGASYTPNGKLNEVWDGNNTRTAYHYDGFDRLSKVRYPGAGDGVPSWTDYQEYGYDRAATWSGRAAAAEPSCTIATTR